MLSGAVDTRSVTARRREVDMQIRRLRIGKKPRDRTFELTPIYQLPSLHHRAGVIGTNREHARSQLLGDLIDGIVGRIALADVDRKAHAIR